MTSDTDLTQIQETFQFISELTKLKLVFRNTLTQKDRKESTAEHSWSASMIVMTLMDSLKAELGEIDELKTIKLILIHDIVEIYAGDVMAFDLEARKHKEAIEIEALEKLVALCPHFGTQLRSLWHEFEKRESLEAKIAKAADAICPIFQRLQTKQSYIPFQITVADLERTKYPSFAFSHNFMALYQKLKLDLLREGLIQDQTSNA